MTHQDLLAIAQEFGNPVYVYDASIMEAQYKRLAKAFKGVKKVQFHYAVKALSNTLLMFDAANDVLELSKKNPYAKKVVDAWANADWFTKRAKVAEEIKLTVFKVEGYSEEKYHKDQLISYNSKTLQNNKEKFVNLIFDKDKNKFNIKGSSYSGEASINNIVGNWWNHKILQTDSQISPISGSIKKQVVKFIGKEKINQYGKTYEVNHLKLKSKDMSLPKNKRLDFDIWYDQKNTRIIKVSYSRMGNWEYRLKIIE